MKKMKKNNQEHEHMQNQNGSEDVSIKEFSIKLKKELSYLTKEIRAIKNAIAIAKNEDPIIDLDFIKKDMNIGRTKFNSDVLPHLNFLFKPPGMRVYRCRLSDYEKWKEKQYKELSFDKNLMK
jgi:hypothetical protein